MNTSNRAVGGQAQMDAAALSILWRSMQIQVKD